MKEKTKGRNPSEPRVLFAIESSFTGDYLDSLVRLGFAIAAGVLTRPPRWSLRGVPVVLQSDEVNSLLLELPVVLCPITPKRRVEAHKQAITLGFKRFASIVDPTATMPEGVVAGKGLFINANATLGAEVELDDFVTVNRAASVGHHTVLEEFATVGPGATLASQCRIGKRVMIGAGAVVAPSVKIGDDATVGAGAVVFRNVEPRVTVIGNPARVTRPGKDDSVTASP